MTHYKYFIAQITMIISLLFTKVIVLHATLSEPYCSLKKLPEHTSPIQWAVNTSVLEDIFHKNKIKIAVEIGSWIGGGATKHIAELLKNKEGARLYAIDTWAENTAVPPGERIPSERVYQQFLSNMIWWNLTDIVVPCKIRSVEAASILNVGPDLVFINGEYVSLENLQAWYPTVKHHGILCGSGFKKEITATSIKHFATQYGLLLHTIGDFWRLCKGNEDFLYYSQMGQDQFIYERFFKQKRNGIFVDIGAHDGESFSNTKFLEKYLGWSGICVEPIPEIYERLKSNRSCTCIQGCITEKSGPVAFARVHGYSEMLSGVVSNYHPSHINRINAEINTHGGKIEAITVKGYNLTQLLLDHNIRHVDYLSLDIEGGELAILKSIDFKQIEIDVIDVENNYQEDFNQFLSPLGYEKVAEIGCDEIFQRKHVL
jgi:FkbM family methyltransferase